MTDQQNSPLKVLMVLPNLRVSNGVATFAMNYYRSIDHDRVMVDFALLSDIETPYYKDIIDNDNKIFILPSIKQISEHIRSCKKILAEGNYDIVHDSSLLKTVPILFLSKLAGVPIRILHSHATKMGETAFKDIRNRALLPLLKVSANSFFACSEAAGKSMFGNSAFTVVPNVISAKVFRYDESVREQVRRSMGIGPDEVVIATVGRPSYQKNPFFAVDVITAFLKTHDNARYWWIGSGPLDDKVREYVASCGMQDRISLLGSRNDVKDLYQAMDIFFLPSLFEGLPLTGVEAQAMGLPSLLSDTITKELIYTDLVEMESLNAQITQWGDKLASLSERHPNRIVYNSVLSESIYSSEGAGKRLESIYRGLLDG